MKVTFTRSYYYLIEFSNRKKFVNIFKDTVFFIKDKEMVSL